MRAENLPLDLASMVYNHPVLFMNRTQVPSESLPPNLHTFASLLRHRANERNHPVEFARDRCKDSRALMAMHAHFRSVIGSPSAELASGPDLSYTLSLIAPEHLLVYPLTEAVTRLVVLLVTGGFGSARPVPY